MILPKVIGKKGIIPSITTVVLIVLLYAFMLSTLDNMPFLDATLESLLFFLNATVRILSAWLIALAITWFFVSLSTRVNLENEFFGGKPSRRVQYLFSIFGSFLLFVTAFEYLHTKINIISLNERKYQLVKLVDISALINLNPTSAVAFAAIFFVFSYSIVIFMYALVSNRANSDKENLSESFMGTFLLLTVYIVLGVILPILWIYYPEMQNMLSWWDFVRIYGVLFAIGLMIHYFFTKKIKVVSMMSELKKRADEFKQLLHLSDNTKDNKNVPLGVFLSRRDLEPLVDNKENFANLNFALTFASKSFLIAIFMPLLLSNISMIFVFGVFLISGAFVWIESIKLGGSVSSTVKYIPKEKNISDLEPVKINGTSIMVSAFLDSLFSLDGYLTMGIIGALLFSGLSTLEAAKNIPFFYWYLFPQDFLVAFAALVAAFILAFGLDSLAKNPHVLLFILGLVSIGPQIFKIILLYSPTITNVEVAYFLFVVLMIFVIIFFVGRAYPPLKGIKYTKIKILAPRNVSVLPIVHEKNPLSKFAEIEYVESPFVIYREMTSFLNILTGRPDAVVLDYLTYLTLKLSKKFKYTAVMQLGTSGYSLLVPKHMLRRMVYEKLKRSIGSKVDNRFLEEIKAQVNNYNEKIERFTNPDNKELRQNVDEVIKEIIDYFLKEKKILVAIPSVQPLVRETLLEGIIKYAIANLLNAEASRLGIQSHVDDFLGKIVLTPTTPEQIRSTAYLFDLILLAEPYVSWLTLAVNDEKAIARVLWDSFAVDASLLKLVEANNDLDAGFYGGLPPHVLAVDDRLIKKVQEILRKEDNDRLKKKLKIYMDNPSASMFKGLPLSVSNKVYPLLASIKIISEREFSYFVSRLCKVDHRIISPNYIPSLQLTNLRNIDASKPLSIGIDYIAHLITGIRDKKRLVKEFSSILKDITSSEYILSLLVTIYSYCAIQMDVTTSNGEKSYIMSVLCNAGSASILKDKTRKIFNYILSDSKYGNKICDPTFIEEVKRENNEHNRIRKEEFYKLIIEKLDDSNVIDTIFDKSILKSSSAIQTDLIQLINNFNAVFNPYSLSNFAAEFITVSFLQSSWIEPHLSKRTLAFQSPLLGCSILIPLLYKMLCDMLHNDNFKSIHPEIKNVCDTLRRAYKEATLIPNIDCSKSKNVMENEYTNQLYSSFISDISGVGTMICNLLEKMREKCIVSI
ncbi:MAG: hypothetical protein ACP6IS_10025 [Candidatus Asgardarchaeia archaeon]